MARADLLVNLVKAASQDDDALFRTTVEAVIAEERAKQHHVLADQLALAAKMRRRTPTSIGRESDAQGLVFEVVPNRTLADLVLSDAIVNTCRELIEEQHRADLLRSYGVEPRHSVLMVGPPGNGKTSLAEALAEALFVPLYVARYEGLVGAYLGETAGRLSQLFEFVRQRKCVLFLDEFDSIAKERGDLHETGEIKRVVSSLLLQVDRLPSYVVVVAATNHPELLDRAVGRRFQLHLNLDPPRADEIGKWLTLFESRSHLHLQRFHSKLINSLLGCSYAELELFGSDVLRRHILAGPDSHLATIVDTRLKLWHNRQEALDLSGSRQNGRSRRTTSHRPTRTDQELAN